MFYTVFYKMSNYTNKDNNEPPVIIENEDGTETQIIKSDRNNELKPIQNQVTFRNNTVATFNQNQNQVQLQQNHFQNQMTPFQNNQFAFNQNQNQYKPLIVIGNTNPIKEFKVPERSIPPQQLPQIDPINSSFNTINKDGEYYINKKIDSKLNGFDKLKSDLNLQPSNFNEMKNGFKFNLNETERKALGRTMDFNTLLPTNDEELIENYLKVKIYGEHNLGNFPNTPLYGFLSNHLDYLKKYINRQNYGIFEAIIDILNGENSFKPQFKDHVIKLINIYQNVYNSIKSQNKNKNNDQDILNRIIKLTNAYLNSITYKELRKQNIGFFNTSFKAMQNLVLSLDNINLENINKNIESIKDFVTGNFTIQNDFNNNLMNYLKMISDEINEVIEQGNSSVENIDTLKNQLNILKESFNDRTFQLEKQKNEINSNLEKLDNLSKSLSKTQSLSVQDISNIQDYLQQFSFNIGNNIIGQVGSIIQNIPFVNGQISGQQVENIKNVILQSIEKGIVQMIQMIKNTEEDINNLKELRGKVEKLEKSVNTNNLRDTVSGLENRMNEFKKDFTQVKDGFSQSISSNETIIEMNNKITNMNNKITKMEEDYSNQLKKTNEKITKLEKELEEKEKIIKENEMGLKKIKQKRKLKKERKIRYNISEVNFREEIGNEIDELNKSEIKTHMDLLKYLNKFLKLINIASEMEDDYILIKSVYILLKNLSKYKINQDLNNRISIMMKISKDYLPFARDKNNNMSVILKDYGKDFKAFKELITDIHSYLKKLIEDNQE